MSSVTTELNDDDNSLGILLRGYAIPSNGPSTFHELPTLRHVDKHYGYVHF